MVNCNPETVSTDYDTSDRLYFEPLGVEEVLAVLRARAAGRRRHPVRRPDAAEARARDRGGRLPRPRHAVRARSTSPRTASASARCSSRSACAARSGASPRSATEAYAIAHRIGYPVLVRPSYVLGGRAMRVCYTPKQVVDAFHANVHGRTLVDRFLENAIEIDVDALSDGEDTYIGARDAARRGGRRPLRRLRLRAAGAVARRPRRRTRSRTRVRALAKALGVVGLLNVQLAVADGDVFVLEANPRASRTVPFASKATGVNLVAAPRAGSRSGRSSRSSGCRRSGRPRR